MRPFYGSSGFAWVSVDTGNLQILLQVCLTWATPNLLRDVGGRGGEVLSTTVLHDAEYSPSAYQ